MVSIQGHQGSRIQKKNSSECHKTTRKRETIHPSQYAQKLINHPVNEIQNGRDPLSSYVLLQSSVFMLTVLFGSRMVDRIQLVP